MMLMLLFIVNKSIYSLSINLKKKKKEVIWEAFVSVKPKYNIKIDINYGYLNLFFNSL